jgi:hypothetical protein
MRELAKICGSYRNFHTLLKRQTHASMADSADPAAVLATAPAVVPAADPATVPSAEPLAEPAAESSAASNCDDAAAEVKARNLQRMMDLVVHTATCVNPACPSCNCLKMKTLFVHGLTCQIEAPARKCQMCRRLWTLLQAILPPPASHGSTGARLSLFVRPPCSCTRRGARSCNAQCHAAGT